VAALKKNLRLLAFFSPLLYKNPLLAPQPPLGDSTQESVHLILLHIGRCILNNVYYPQQQQKNSKDTKKERGLIFEHFFLKKK
jgi:hypothetical protein